MTDGHRRPSRRDALRIGGGMLAAGLGLPALDACARAPEPNTGGSGSGSGGGGKGGKGGGGGKGDTFTIYWNPGHLYDAYKEVIAKFGKDHGITVNWQKFQWPDLTTKFQADAAAGTVPDLLEQPSGDAVVALAVTGDLMPLDDFIAKDGEQIGFPNDWQPRTVEAHRYKGKQYGVQLHLTCSQLYYNKKMLAAAGVQPPGTWDELLDASKKLTKDGVYALALNQDYSYSEPWILQNSAVGYDPATKTVLAPNAKAIEALQFQHDLVYKYKYSAAPAPSSDYSGPQKLLSAKRAAMIITGPWDIDPIHKGSPDIDLGLAPPLKGAVRKTIFAGSGVGIPTKAKHPDLAWDLIKRLTTLDVELAITKATSVSMPRISWGKRPEVASDPVIGQIAKALPYGVDFWQELAPTGKSAEVSDAYKTLYQSVVISGKSPESVMPAFLQAAQKALG